MVKNTKLRASIAEWMNSDKFVMSEKARAQFGATERTCETIIGNSKEDIEIIL